MATGPVVCDASPLILLAVTGQLDLLRALFGEVLIAPEVHEEVVVRGAGRPGAMAVAGSRFVVIRKVTDETRAQSIAETHGLGRGEAATLALAGTVGATLALIDDRRGRAAARILNIRLAGTVAILERAHELGLLVDLRTQYGRLQAASGWIAPSILNASLQRKNLPPLD